MAYKHLKGCSTLPLMKCILKPQWHSSTHLVLHTVRVPYIYYYRAEIHSLANKWFLSATSHMPDIILGGRWYLE